MWEKLALLPLAFQSVVCPSRTSDTVLLVILSWIAGFCCGVAVAALILSPGLRGCLLRALAVALREVAPAVVPRTDRLRQCAWLGISGAQTVRAP